MLLAQLSSLKELDESRPDTVTEIKQALLLLMVGLPSCFYYDMF